MPTPPFALPLHLETYTGTVSLSTILDANDHAIAVVNTVYALPIVAAVNRVAVLEQALEEIHTITTTTLDSDADYALDRIAMLSTKALIAAALKD